MTTPSIRKVETARERASFVRAGRIIHANDPLHRPPLDFQEKARIDPKANPVLQRIEAALWIAEHDSAPVGRISAQIDPEHQKRHGGSDGQFGFLEAVDDADVVALLLQTAEEWLKARGCTRALGPFNFTINEECGLLVDGFDTPAVMMMPHGRSYLPDHVAACGYEKAKDLIAYGFDMTRAEKETGLTRFAARAVRDGALRVRGPDLKNFDREVRTVMAIFNDAWSENWGFIPFSDAEIGHMAGELKTVIAPHSLRIAEIDGTPQAFTLVLPDMNDLTRDLNGRLLPLGWAKLLWRLKISGPRRARLPLLGVRKALQGGPLGAAATFAILDEIRAAHVARGVRFAELSWILEDNHAVRSVIEAFGAAPYKTYRIVAKNL